MREAAKDFVAFATFTVLKTAVWWLASYYGILDALF